MRDTLGFVDHADIEDVANGSSALSWTPVAEDVNTIVMIGKTYALQQRIARKIQETDWFEEFASGANLNKGSTVSEIIAELERRTHIDLVRLSLIINVGFHHPDAEIARKTANFIAQEYIDFTSEVQASNKWSKISLRALSSAGPARLVQVNSKIEQGSARNGE